MQKNFTNPNGLGHFELSVLGALISLRDKSLDELRSVLSFSPIAVSLPVINKFGWLIVSSANPKFNTVKLELFHDLLINFKYILPDLTYKEFEEHFFGLQTPDGKIKWIGKICALAILFDKLHRKEIITFSGNIYDMLVVHFKDGDGKKLKRDSLERLASRGISKSEERKIDKIVCYLSC